jgi:hypothetical protein
MLEMFMLAGWAALWTLGGYWITSASFNLRKNELALSGLAVGLFLQTLFANMLSRLVALPLAFWLAALAVFILGTVLTCLDDWRGLYRFKIVPGQWLAFALLAYTFFAIGRGLSLFDDYAHLPTVSLLAAGDIPPHFPLDPAVPYSYHYFLLLFSAELIRIGDLFSWTALDAARALAFALTTMMAVIWGQRITKSQAGGILTGAFRMFAGGTRWLLLLLPVAVIAWISPNITMLGSAAQSAPDLQTALIGNWEVDGAGAAVFPFAFANGIVRPGVLGHGPNGIVGGALSLFLLLSFNRWKGWKGAVVTVFLLAASQLLGEVGIVLSVASWGLMTIFYMITHRSWRLPASLAKWWVVLIAGWLLGLVQGGAIGGALYGLVSENALGVETSSYQSMGVQLAWPPAIVSSHLGVLSLFNPAQLLTAIFEIGPIFLVFPLVVIWGLKAYRAKRWYEATLVLSACISLVLVFFQFSGSTGVRNTSRFYDFLGTCSFWAAPLIWLWYAKRKRWVKALVICLTGITLVGGIVLFGTQLPAAQQPVTSTLLNTLDGRMTAMYWNRLEPGSMVFDSSVSRSPVIFGRGNDSSNTWYERKLEYLALYQDPDPFTLRAAGYDYIYFDELYWAKIGADRQAKFSNACVVTVEQLSQPNPRDLTQTETRTLLNIRSCK